MFARVLASVTLSVSFLAGPVVLAAPHAQADEVATAQARVNKLQVLVRQTTTRLVAGTREWERDQAQLRVVQARLAAVAARVKQQESVADQGRERVAVVARRMYMTPVGNTMRMALGMDAEQVMGLLRTQGELRQIAASDSEVVRRAQFAQVQLSRTKAEVADVSRQARAIVDRSAQRLRELNALAESTSSKLVSAENELMRARARKAARLAAAAAAAAAKARASRLRIQAHSSGGATCSQSSTDGMGNGNLDPAVLCPLWAAPGHRLRTDAARAFDAMSKYHAKTAGQPLCVTDSYRSYAGQVDVYRRKPGLAAVPGTSNHGWGLAVDFCGGVQTFGSPGYDWMKANAGRFGWHHPSWAEPSGEKPEAWHWEFGS